MSAPPHTGDLALANVITAVSRLPSAGRDALVSLGLACLYFGAARLGLHLLAQPESVAVFWPASGCAAGAVVLLGRRRWIAIALGVMVATVAANLLGDRNLPLAVMFGFCNAGEALLFGWFLERMRRPYSFGGLRSVLWFFASAAISTGLMAAIAAASIRLGTASIAGFVSIWQAWWVSDAIGIIMFAPLPIALGTLSREWPSRPELREGATVLSFLFIIAGVMYLAPPHWANNWIPQPVAAIFPMLLWVAARCRPVFLTAGLVVVALIIVWAATQGYGILGDPAMALAERVYSARLSMISIAFSGLAFLAVFSERRNAESALRESEQRRRLALDAAQIGTFVWHGPTDVIEPDDRMLELLGLPANTDLLQGSVLVKVFHSEDHGRFMEAVRRSGDPSGTGVLREEIRVVHPNRPERWLAISGQTIPAGEKGPARLVGTAADITERKRAQDVLSDTNLRLEARVAERTRQLEQEMAHREETQRALAQSQRMEAIGQLTGGIAHDINNMLTVVSGNLELATPHIENPAGRKSAQQALSALDMGAALNRRLLSFARRRKLDEVQLDLNERVNDMSALLQRTLSEQISLVAKLEPELWTVRADPSEIDNALLNLAFNARDAMARGGTLTIETANVTLDPPSLKKFPDVKAGDFVRLSVIDTGEGMTPETLNRAIEPFFTTKETGKGSGLGLSSVYGFAKQSGGFLDLASTPGAGTTVSIYLPRVAREATIAAATTQASVPTGRGEVILLVEDDERVREVAIARLESLGYAVVEAKSGPDAIRVLQSDLPLSLVFSDVVMPGGMTGYDVARRARAERPDIKVLLTSGYTQADQTGEEELALTLLPKPYDRAKLGWAIHTALTS